jgi:hypothetical protein
MASEPFEPDWSDIFQEVQQEMTLWRRAHPKATMREIELENERVLARLHARMVADLAAASTLADLAAQPPEARPFCPDCAVPLSARGKKRRTLWSHGNQAVSLERSAATCPQCERAFFPSG